MYCFVLRYSFIVKKSTPSSFSSAKSWRFEKYFERVEGKVRWESLKFTVVLKAVEGRAPIHKRKVLKMKNGMVAGQGYSSLQF